MILQDYIRYIYLSAGLPKLAIRECKIFVCIKNKVAKKSVKTLIFHNVRQLLTYTACNLIYAVQNRRTILTKQYIYYFFVYFY